MSDITLIPVQEHEKDEFIRALQQSFRLAMADDLDDGEEVISREEIEESMNAPKAESYHIVADGEKAGGAVIVVNAETERGSLDLLFMFPQKHGSGLGGKAWRAIERLHPEVRVWETHTPYFEKRNIHFYVNKCGFKIVEFFNPHHPDTTRMQAVGQDEKFEYFFRFEKEIPQQPFLSWAFQTL